MNKTRKLLILSICMLASAISAYAEPWRLDQTLSTPDWLTVDGDILLRYESLDNQFRSGGSGGDQIAVSRTLLRAEAKANDFTFMVEGIDARQELADTDSTVTTGIVDAVDLLQAKVGWTTDDFIVAGSKSTFTAGRMTLDYGSRRLVARNAFRNTINAFTGLEWQWQIDDKNALKAFFTMPVTRLPSDKASLLDNQIEWDRESTDILFWGLFYERKDVLSGAKGELYLYGLSEKDVDFTTTNDRQLWTPGARIVSSAKPGEFNYQVEGALQFGEARNSKSASNTTDLDVFAYMFHASVGYTFDTAWKPQFQLLYDYASGDDDPTDGDYERFDSLFGVRRAEFGPTGIYGAFSGSNINTPGWRVILKPSKVFDVTFTHRFFWLASDTDAWTTASVRDSSGSSGDEIGQLPGRRMGFQIAM